MVNLLTLCGDDAVKVSLNDSNVLLFVRLSVTTAARLPLHCCELTNADRSLAVRRADC